MLSGMVDSLMISRISDNAVGAIGTANIYFGMLFLLFAVTKSISRSNSVPLVDIDIYLQDF